MAGRNENLQHARLVLVLYILVLVCVQAPARRLIQPDLNFLETSRTLLSLLRGSNNGFSLRLPSSPKTPRQFAGLRKATASACVNSCFYVLGNLQISGIHIAETHLKTVIVLDRSDSNNTNMKLPGTNQNAYAEELNVASLSANGVSSTTQRALDVKSNVFCSTGQFLPDGTLLSIGGASDAASADPLLNGSFSVRAFRPCADRTCDFQLAGTLTSKRWYPTAQIMPDGRVMIVGGATVYGNIAINTYPTNNPTIEYYPRRPGEGSYFSDFLDSTVPYNLYPFVHLLPSGLVFIFAAQSWTLFDPITNADVPGSYPPISVVDDLSGTTVHYPIYRSYPVSGTSVLFPLTSGDNYTAEVMLCGGGSSQAVLGTDGGKKGGAVPADEYCWRIQPEAPNPVWTPEWMCDYPSCLKPLRRVMGDAVLLVDGSVLLLNGAGTGFQGLKQTYASSPVLTPIMYLPQTHKWFQQPLASTTIPRMYHSSALLLHDATVLVTGSNPNAYLSKTGSFPTDFRVEMFTPPYLWTGLARPQITSVPSSIPVKSSFTVTFTASQSSPAPFARRFAAVLINPGFSTHNQRHGMRNVNLDLLAVTASGTTFTALLRAPPSLNHVPPGMYWFHVLDNGVPNISGVAVNVTAAIA